MFVHMKKSVLERYNIQNIIKYKLCIFNILNLIKVSLPQLDNVFSQRVNAIIGKTREMRRGVYYPHLYIVKEDGDQSLRLWFLSHIIEDRTDTVMSYHQWLSHLK